jgi:hypothetical protein
MAAVGVNRFCALARRGRSVAMGCAGTGCEEASGADNLTALVRLMSCSHLKHQTEQASSS